MDPYVHYFQKALVGILVKQCRALLDLIILSTLYKV